MTIFIYDVFVFVQNFFLYLMILNFDGLSFLLFTIGEEIMHLGADYLSLLEVFDDLEANKRYFS